MQLLACFWIALCLVVDSSTKYVKSTEDDTSTGDFPITLYGNADGNINAGTCDDDTNCKNGAKCERRGMSKFCKCLKGTEGDYCEEISECKYLNCEPDARCTYDASLQKAICSSSNREREFDKYFYMTKSCDADSNCKNGGTCNPRTNPKYCSCLKGTEGDFCEVVTECRDFDCGSDRLCKFDLEIKKAVCLCKITDLHFDHTRGKCIRTCDDDKDCRNGGTCKKTGGANFCRCLKGTEGDYCEVVTECKYLNCEPEARCTYDVRMETNMCVCRSEDLHFDHKQRKCIRTCKDDTTCMNGGECKDSGSGKVCRCLKGMEGDYCEEVSGCKDMNCGYEARCTYDVRLQTETCVCRNEDLHFDYNQRKCIRTCNSDWNCMNGGECIRSGNDNICRCRIGTEGDYCEIVPECKDLHCGPDRRCKYDPQTQTAKCVCRNKDLHFDHKIGKCISK